MQKKAHNEKKFNWPWKSWKNPPVYLLRNNLLFILFIAHLGCSTTQPTSSYNFRESLKKICLTGSGKGQLKSLNYSGNFRFVSDFGPDRWRMAVTIPLQGEVIFDYLPKEQRLVQQGTYVEGLGAIELLLAENYELFSVARNLKNSNDAANSIKLDWNPVEDQFVKLAGQYKLFLKFSDQLENDYWKMIALRYEDIRPNLLNPDDGSLRLSFEKCTE